MPKNSDFRVAIALAALLIVLSLSFGSYYLYQHMGVQTPLEKRLASLDGVEKVELESQGQSYDIVVTLKKVDNLQAIYQSIRHTIELALPGRRYELHLVDRPDSLIEDFYQRMQPAVYESLAGNKFIWLDEELARRSAQNDLSYRLFVDASYLYIQLEDKNAYLYQVIERSPDASNIEKSGDGSA